MLLNRTKFNRHRITIKISKSWVSEIWTVNKFNSRTNCFLSRRKESNKMIKKPLIKKWERLKKSKNTWGLLSRLIMKRFPISLHRRINHRYSYLINRKFIQYLNSLYREASPTSNNRMLKRKKNQLKESWSTCMKCKRNIGNFLKHLRMLAILWSLRSHYW